MSLCKLGDKKYCITRRGKFWSGTGWTIVYEFCKAFDFSSAINLIEKRFHRMKPLPRLERCSKFERRKKKAEQNKSYQKKLRNQKNV